MLTPQKKGGLTKKINNLSKIAKGKVFVTAAKKNLNGVRKIAIDGIVKDELRLKRLKKETIRQKQREGSPSPKTPLYKFGALANSLQIRKLKSGYRLAPYGRHPRAKMTNRQLWAIHEYGAGNNPARLPLRKSVRKWLRSEERKVIGIEYKKAVRRQLRNT
jgi:hypothetical protein